MSSDQALNSKLSSFAHLVKSSSMRHSDDISILVFIEMLCGSWVSIQRLIGGPILTVLWTRGGRYVLIIHFYVESGQKMIQFNIQFKIESKIFIQWIIHSIFSQKYRFNELFIQYSVRNIDSKFYSKNWIKTIQIYVIKPTQWKPAKRERFPKIGLEFINSRFGSLFRLPRVPIRSLLYLLYWSWVPISKLAGFRNRGMWGPGDLKGPFLSIVTPIEEKNANYSQITYACQDFWFIKSFIQFLLAK